VIAKYLEKPNRRRILNAGETEAYASEVRFLRNAGAPHLHHRPTSAYASDAVLPTETLEAL